MGNEQFETSGGKNSGTSFDSNGLLGCSLWKKHSPPNPNQTGMGVSLPVTEEGGGNQYLEGGNKSQQRAIAGARVATRSEVIGNRWEAPGRVEDDGFPGVRRLRGIRLRGIPRGAVAGRTLGAERTVGRKVRAIRGPSERFGRVGMSCVTLTQTMRCLSEDATMPRFFSTAQLFVRNRVRTLVKICAWCMV